MASSSSRRRPGTSSVRPARAPNSRAREASSTAAGGPALVKKPGACSASPLAPRAHVSSCSMSRACNITIFFGIHSRGAFVFSSLHCVAPCQPSSTSKQPTVAVGDFIEVEDVDDQQELFFGARHACSNYSKPAISSPAWVANQCSIYTVNCRWDRSPAALQHRWLFGTLSTECAAASRRARRGHRAPRSSYACSRARSHASHATPVRPLHRARPPSASAWGVSDAR